jgi:putative hemolysin
MRTEVRTCPYSRIVVARENDVDNPLGVVHKKDLLDSLLDNGEFNVESWCRRRPSSRSPPRC